MDANSPDTNTSEGKKKINRRDFLKVARTGIGVVARVFIDLSMRERFTFYNEHKIDMNNYLSKRKKDGKDEWTINFTTLRTLFPDVVKKSENGDFFFKNDSEKRIVLDFSSAGGKEIRLYPNNSKVAKSNMSWEKSRESTSFDTVTGGLFLEGAFAVRGSLSNEPIFVGDVLDRVISFKGTGNENCTVEDIAFRGLNAFKQDSNGGGDCPSPAFISGDDVNLDVQGIKIDYTPVKPDWADETNSQLAKGIILHNTRNNKPLKMTVAYSLIKGLEWDGICSNGLANIQVEKSRLLQNRSYKQKRGVGIASTFNSPDGKISIIGSTVDYCKGTCIWINEKEDLPLKNNNLEIFDSTISNTGWAISIDAEQRTKISNLNILPDYDGGSQKNFDYWPLELYWKGKKFDMSFDNINFNLSPDMGDGIKLMFFANWEGFNDFSSTSPREFFDTNFGSWGDISVKIKNVDQIEEFKILKQQFTDFINNLKTSIPPINPSGMMLFFDNKTKQFAILFATELDSQTGNMNFSEPYYFNNEQKKSKRQFTSILPMIKN